MNFVSVSASTSAPAIARSPFRISTATDGNPRTHPGVGPQSDRREAYAALRPLIPHPEEFPTPPSRCPGGRERGGPIIGHFAREHGALIPSRLIASAKSWLSNPHMILGSTCCRGSRRSSRKSAPHWVLLRGFLLEHMRAELPRVARQAGSATARTSRSC